LTEFSIELSRQVIAEWHGDTRQELDDFLRALEIMPSQLAELGVDSLPPIGSYCLFCCRKAEGSICRTVPRSFPGGAGLRATPRDDRDLIVSAANSWALVYDNIS